jgi:uncharacterized protein YndB with AHSA1/START domain
MISSHSLSDSTSVRKSIRVRATAERAFHVFTDQLDGWWPRTHHIGNAPLQEAILEGRAGGRCYSKQTDGTECDWGTVLEWDPPQRFVLAWQVSPAMQYEPNVANASEVEVQFTPEDGGYTRVDLEHRYFERHGAGADTMRTKVGSRGGWGELLRLYGERVEQEGNQ